MRISPPLYSSLPPTIRAILQASKNASAGTSTAAVTSPTPKLQPPASECLNLSPSASLEPAGGETVVRGWVKSKRGHKNVSFAAINDGSGADVQAVWKGNNGVVDGIHVGSSVELKGRLEQSKGKGQALELQVESTRILGDCDPEVYPIQKKHLPEHFLREHAHLRFRTTSTAAVMRVRDALLRDWHNWFEDNEFYHIHTPLLTSSDCEGAGETFQLKRCGEKPITPVPDIEALSSNGGNTSPKPALPSEKADHFFPHPVNLTVSSQLHLEAPTHSLGRTYTLSPSFRAEPSLTSRHLAEFYMLEAEIAFVDNLDKMLDVVEDSIKVTLRNLLDGESRRATNARKDLEAIALGQIPESELSAKPVKQLETPRQDLRDAADVPFARISYTEVIELLEQRYQAGELPTKPRWDQGLSTEQEKWLAGEHFRKPVFVTRYPSSIKPFYMLPTNHDPASGDNSRETVECFDLLIPQLGELIGGSLREHRLESLERKMEELGLNKDGEHNWYLDLRRYGSVPHGGWGMGWDRYVSWVTGVGNLRDVVAFPRWYGNCRY